MSEPVYIPLADVAKVCVLTSYTLQTKHWPAHWGAPHHFRYAGTAVVVNRDALPDLVAELKENGQAGTAEQLQRWINAQSTADRTADFIASRAAITARAEGAWFKKGQYE